MSIQDWEEVRKCVETLTRHDLIVLYTTIFLTHRFRKEFQNVLNALAAFIGKVETVQFLSEKLKIVLQSVKALAESSSDPTIVKETLKQLPDITETKQIPGSDSVDDRPSHSDETSLREREDLQEALQRLKEGK